MISNQGLLPLMSAIRSKAGFSSPTRRHVLSAGAALLLNAPGGARADWRADIGTFRVGIVGEPGKDTTVAGLAELKRAYTLALGLPVEFFVADSYRALIEAQANRRVEYAVYSTMAYAAAALSCACVEPLVAPTAASGAIGIRSVLITTAADFTDIKAIGSHRVAVAGTDDLAGALVPLSALRGLGLLQGGDSFLVRVPTVEEGEARLLAGTVDAMFGWVETGIGTTPLPGSGSLQRLAQMGRTDVRLVWTSELLRFGPHAIRTDLDTEVRRRLVPFLTGLNSSAPEVFALLEAHHTGGFAPVDEADYATALDLVRVWSTP